MPTTKKGAARGAPAPVPDPSPATLASIGAATLAGACSQGVGQVLFAGPSLPYTADLFICRAPGGFVVFENEEDADNANAAIGVAATPLALATLIDDWGHKAAPRRDEYPA